MKSNQTIIRKNHMEQLHFNKHISTHIFRHIHINFLNELEIPLEVIQDCVEHTRGSRVADINLHFTQKTHPHRQVSSVLFS